MEFSDMSPELVQGLRKVQESLEPKPNLLGLVVAICKTAKGTTDILDEHLFRSFPKHSQEYLHLRVSVFFEIASFLAHLASRVALKELGPLKRQALNEYVGVLLVEFTVSHFYQPISGGPPKLPLEGFKESFWRFLNESEREYGSCKSWILKQDEDIAFADKVVGGKSEGLLNLLTDNVVRILNENNPITYYKIMLALTSSIRLSDFRESVLKADKEL
jgi:hypothetical protein